LPTHQGRFQRPFLLDTKIMIELKMLTELTAQAEARGADVATLRALIEEASELGAGRAMARLGLDDPQASKDMAELRELLTAWRDAKASARKAVVDWLVRGFLAVLLIGLAVKLGLPGLVSQ
jgi:multidrug efflux pump subunit AcrA (membrane-fusion protein)